jgi:hypothetical protein
MVAELTQAQNISPRTQSLYPRKKVLILTPYHHYTLFLVLLLVFYLADLNVTISHGAW